MYRHTILWISLGLFTVTLAQAQAPDTSRIQDALLSHLVGKWTTTGEVRGDSVQYGADATWGLGHQFLRLRMSDINDPPQYAGHVYVGYDSAAEQYVAHWLDTTGGQASTTFGTGQRSDSTLSFRFDYPDGPFRTSFE